MNYKLSQVEVRLRLQEASALYSTEKINTPERAFAIMAAALRDLDREHLVVVNLDAAMHPINFHTVAIGSINACMAPIPNIFKTAILSNSCSIILLHQHPSGSLEPSKEDVAITEKVASAGALLDIMLLDHIIVAGGSGAYISLKEMSPDLFRSGSEAICA